jgi:hypothetical protein
MTSKESGVEDRNSVIQRVKQTWKLKDPNAVAYEDVRVLFHATRAGGGELTSYRMAALLGRDRSALQNLFRVNGFGSAPAGLFGSIQQVLTEVGNELREEQVERDIDALEETRREQLESELIHERELKKCMEVQVEELRAKVTELEAKVTELAAMLRDRDARLEEEAVDIMKVRNAEKIEWELDKLRELTEEQAMELERVKELARREIDELQHRLEERRLRDQRLHAELPHLARFVEHVASRKSDADRYPDEIKNFALLFAPFGEHRVALMTKFFGFPTWRTIQRWMYHNHEGHSGDVRHSVLLCFDCLCSLADVSGGR